MMQYDDFLSARKTLDRLYLGSPIPSAAEE